MRDFETSMVLAKYDILQETRKWINELPVFHFEKEWDVKIIPPFGGAVIRFYINYNDKHVSVYFDAYSQLGWMVDENKNPIPYFEYYDGEKYCYRYRMNEIDKMMKDIKNFLNN